jgi:hypothetical protein
MPSIGAWTRVLSSSHIPDYFLRPFKTVKKPDGHPAVQVENGGKSQQLVRTLVLPDCLPLDVTSFHFRRLPKSYPRMCW